MCDFVTFQRSGFYGSSKQACFHHYWTELMLGGADGSVPDTIAYQFLLIRGGYRMISLVWPLIAQWSKKKSNNSKPKSTVYTAKCNKIETCRNTRCSEGFCKSSIAAITDMKTLIYVCVWTFLTCVNLKTDCLRFKLDSKRIDGYNANNNRVQSQGNKKLLTTFDKSIPTHVIMSVISPCVSQSGEPCIILACDRLMSLL